MKGRSFAGRILKVDLTKGDVTKRPLGEDLVRSYIGGFGISAKIALDLIPSRVDPLAPENAVILGAGTLSGTMVPGSG